MDCCSVGDRLLFFFFFFFLTVDVMQRWKGRTRGGILLGNCGCVVGGGAMVPALCALDCIRNV